MLATAFGAQLLAAWLCTITYIQYDVERGCEAIHESARTADACRKHSIRSRQRTVQSAQEVVLYRRSLGRQW